MGTKKGTIPNPQATLELGTQIRALQAQGLNLPQIAARLKTDERRCKYALYYKSKSRATTGVKTVATSAGTTITATSARRKLDTVTKILTFESIPLEQRVKIVLEMVAAAD